MLQLSTFKFLNELSNNNNKAWFDENRKPYENAKADFYIFTNKLIEGIAKFDTTITNLTAKDCAFRINRDVRFSKDKSPYKTNFGASISKGGKKINCAGYYFHCQPKESFAAGGFYLPMPPNLAKIRQEIDYNFKEFEKIISNKIFKKYFVKGVQGVESLSRPPKGYDENNPAINFLKMKGFIISQPFADVNLQSKSAISEITKTFSAMHPLITFINTAIE